MNIPNLAIAALFLAGTAANAQGTTRDFRSLDAVKAHPVLTSLVRTGVHVYHDPPDVCADEQLDGMWVESMNALALCTNNMSSYSEFDNTIKHEVYHAIVSCRGGELVHTIEDNAHHATKRDLVSVISLYPQKQHNEELEARNVARLLSDQQIINMVNKYCM